MEQSSAFISWLVQDSLQRQGRVHNTIRTSDIKCRFWGPQNHSRVWEFAGRTHGTHWKLSYSPLRFITMKGRRLKSAQGTDTWGRESSQCRASGSPLPVEAWTTLILSAVMCDHMYRVANQGSLPEAACPEFLLGLGHIGIVDCSVANLGLQPLRVWSW